MPDGAHSKESTKHPRNLRLPEVLARVGLKKTSLYGLIKKGLFPKPRKLMANSRSVGWLEEGVDNYVAGLEVQQSAPPKAQVAEPAKEAVSSAPSQTLRAPAKPTKVSNNHGGKPAASDDVLVPIGWEIMGRPVFLHKKSGKILLDIGHMPFPLIVKQLIGNFDRAMTGDSD
jgi:prophage regulatory protein